MNMASSASHEPVYVPMDAMQNQYVYIQPAQTSPVSVLSVQNPAPSYPDNYLAADEIAISGVKKRKSRTVVHEKWSKEEDKRLSDAVKKYGAKNWKKIASEVGGSRNDVQCLHRWRKVISPELVKGPWTPDEDMIIMKAVRDAGDVNNIKWCEVAAKLKGRIGKQCRERYLNYLDQNIKKSEWTDEEDKILFELQRVIGNRWCEIAKVLPGRSENNIKNRFNSKAKATYLLHHRTPMIPIQNLCTASPEDDPRQPRKKRKLMCPPLQQLLRYLNLSSQMLDSIIPPLAPFQISPNSSNTNCCSSSSSNLNNDLPIPDTVSIDDLTTTTTTNISSAPALLPLTSTTTTTTTTTSNSSNNNSQLNDNIFSNNEENELNLLTKPTLTIVDQPFNNNTINTDNNNNTRLTRNNNNNIGVSTRSRTRNNNNSYYNNYYSGRYSNGRTTTRTTRNSAAAAAYAEKQKKQKEMKLQKQKLQQQQQQQQNQLQQNDFQDQQQQQQQQSQFPQFIYYFQPYIPSFNLNGYENSIYNNEYELSYQQPQSQQQQNPSQQNQQLQLHQLQSLDELDNENPNYIYMSNFSNNNNNNSINLNDSNNSLNSSTISNLMMLTDDSQNGNIEDEDVVRLLLNENGRYTDTLVPIPSFGDDSTTSTSGATSSVVSTTTTITSKSTTTSEDLSVLLNNSSNSLVNDNDKTNNDDTDKAINNL